MRKISYLILALGLISLLGSSIAQGDRPSKKTAIYKDARGREWVAPDSFPTVTKLLQGYGLSANDPDGLAQWIQQSMKQVIRQANPEVELDWVDNAPDDPGRYWEARGRLNGQDCAFWLNLKDGSFTIAFSLDAGGGETLSYPVVTPSAPRPNETLLTYVLARSLSCHCSHSGGSCTVEQCNNGDWCHSNGNSCENGTIVASLVLPFPRP